MAVAGAEILVGWGSSAVDAWQLPKWLEQQWEGKDVQHSEGKKGSIPTLGAVWLLHVRLGKPPI